LQFLRDEVGFTAHTLPPVEEGDGD